MRACAHCGNPLPPNMRSTAKYCGAACRKAAQRARQNKTDPSRPSSKPEPERDAKPAPLTGREFDRMMDGSMEDELRHVRDRLKAYVDDPDTPANAMPNIVAKYLAVCEKLHSLSGGDPLAGLLDEQEVGEDAGASVV